MPFPQKISEDDILARAVEIVKEGGMEALSMRTLADKLGVRASSLYRHFSSRAEMEGAISESAAKVLEERMRGAAKGRKPAEACRAIALEYVRFATDEPALFELLLAPAARSDAKSNGKNLWNFILQTVAAQTRIPDDTTAAVAVWSFVHGYAILQRSGKFGVSGPKGAFDAGIDALTKGLRAGRNS